MNKLNLIIAAILLSTSFSYAKGISQKGIPKLHEAPQKIQAKLKTVNEKSKELSVLAKNLLNPKTQQKAIKNLILSGKAGKIIKTAENLIIKIEKNIKNKELTQPLTNLKRKISSLKKKIKLARQALIAAEKISKLQKKFGL